MKLSELVRDLPVSGDLGNDPEVFGVRHDSRAVAPGELFVAWRGARADGAAHAPEAIARGAVAVVADRPPEVPVAVTSQGTATGTSGGRSPSPGW